MKPACDSTFTSQHVSNLIKLYMLFLTISFIKSVIVPNQGSTCKCYDK